MTNDFRIISYEFCLVKYCLEKSLPNSSTLSCVWLETVFAKFDVLLEFNVVVFIHRKNKLNTKTTDRVKLFTSVVTDRTFWSAERNADVRM